MLTLTDPATAPLFFDIYSERDRLLGPWRRATMTFKGVTCTSRRHDRRVHLRARQITLRCPTCGYESPGWRLGPERPQLRFAGDPHRHDLRLQATNRPKRSVYRSPVTSGLRPRHARRPEAF